MDVVERVGATLAPATLAELREAALADEHGARLARRAGASRPRAGAKRTCRSAPALCRGHGRRRHERSLPRPPDAIRALVEPDRVHRDLYIDEELFALEQEHFFANTWSYVGHESQIPNVGDYITVESPAGR